MWVVLIVVVAAVSFGEWVVVVHGSCLPAATDGHPISGHVVVTKQSDNRVVADRRPAINYGWSPLITLQTIDLMWHSRCCNGFGSTQNTYLSTIRCHCVYWKCLRGGIENSAATAVVAGSSLRCVRQLIIVGHSIDTLSLIHISIIVCVVLLVEIVNYSHVSHLLSTHCYCLCFL